MAKADYIIPIKLWRSKRGLSIQETTESCRGYNRKTVAELRQILADEKKQGLNN